jgi:hypothetical protein
MGLEVQLGKRQISLGKDRDEAFERYRVLILQEQGENPEPTFRRLPWMKLPAYGA